MFSNNMAHANQCGYKPYPPYGCDSSNAQCICHKSNNVPLLRSNTLINPDQTNCEWVFYNCR